MVTMTLSVPDGLKKKMDQFPEINWSEVARQAFREKIEDFLFLLEFKSKSKITMDEAIELGRKVKRSQYKRQKRKKDGTRR